MNGKIFARIIAVLVLVAAVAGIAFFAFNAGVAQGVATKLPAATQPGNMPYAYHGAPFFWHPFFGFLIGLFLLFFVLRMISFIFWGPRWGRGGHMMGHRAWRHGWTEDGVPPMFKEWHDRAHGKQPEENKNNET